MDKFSNKKKCNTGEVQLHLDTPPIPLIKMKYNDNSDKDFAKIKLSRDPMSANPYLYEFKIFLFDNDNPGDFFCSFVIST